MRDNDPVWRDPKTGLWNVFRYEDVTAVLADYRTFSSDFSDVFPDQAELIEGNIVATDPPYHHRLRHLVSQVVYPRAIARLEGRIRELTEKLLDQTGGRTEIELVGDLAYPLPVIVIAELLGVPAADRSRFKIWADALLSQSNADPTDKEAIEATAVHLRKFHDYLREHINQRRIEPREDLLSGLVAAEIEGKRLSDQEIVGFATTLLLAGHITTTALLGNTILCLDEHPQTQAVRARHQRRFRGRLKRCSAIVARSLNTGRVAATEVQLGEQVIAPRQMLIVWLHSANHDERQFENPDEFLIDRNPNPHVGFGKGIHFCLGIPLARLESRIALGVLPRRFPRLRVDPEQPLEEYADPGFNSMQRLDLLVEPA